MTPAFWPKRPASEWTRTASDGKMLLHPAQQFQIYKYSVNNTNNIQQQYTGQSKRSAESYVRNPLGQPLIYVIIILNGQSLPTT